MTPRLSLSKAVNSETERGERQGVRRTDRDREWESNRGSNRGRESDRQKARVRDLWRERGEGERQAETGERDGGGVVVEGSRKRQREGNQRERRGRET